MEQIIVLYKYWDILSPDSESAMKSSKKFYLNRNARFSQQPKCTLSVGLVIFKSMIKSYQSAKGNHQTLMLTTEWYTLQQIIFIFYMYTINDILKYFELKYTKLLVNQLNWINLVHCTLIRDPFRDVIKSLTIRQTPSTTVLY